MVSYDKKDSLLLLRQAMIKEQLIARNITDKAVLAAVEQVPREEFVAPKYIDTAYADSPLPIGLGQTISQPYIVAVMTEQLQIASSDIVLEIGTGCGYQTAVLAQLCKEVYTIEQLSQLQELAQAALARCKIDNVRFLIGNGCNGWPDEIKFDKIIVTAAAKTIPEALIGQLKVGGRIVIPVGAEGKQQLVTGAKNDDGKLETTIICAVRFVKLNP